MTRNSARLTDQRDSYAFSCSPLTIHVRHLCLFPTYRYSCIGVLISRYMYHCTAHVRAVSTVFLCDAPSLGNPVQPIILSSLCHQKLESLRYHLPLTVSAQVYSSARFRTILSKSQYSPTNQMPRSRQILTKNGNSILFKNICFDVIEKPLIN